MENGGDAAAGRWISGGADPVIYANSGCIPGVPPATAHCFHRRDEHFVTNN
jgi:hypothetical protein